MDTEKEEVPEQSAEEPHLLADGGEDEVRALLWHIGQRRERSAVEPTAGESTRPDRLDRLLEVVRRPFAVVGRMRTLPKVKYIPPPNFGYKQTTYVDPATGEKTIEREIRVTTKLAPPGVYEARPTPAKP